MIVGQPTRTRWPRSIEAILKKQKHTTTKSGSRYYPNWQPDHRGSNAPQPVVIHNVANIGDINLDR